MNNNNWEKRFWWMTGILLLFRLFMSLYLDLAPDEAYYWEFARQIDFSYYDHPPMVGWMIALFRLLPSDGQLYVRLPAIISTLLLTWFVFLIGKDYFKSCRVGFWAAFILSFTPAGIALGFITTPDTPLSLAWAFTAYAFLRALNDKRDRWWIGTGLGLAFGALGKYNMILFVPAVAFTILGFKRYRHLVFTRRYWLMVLIAIAGTLPILYWNMTHDWISFKFQFAHGLKENSRTAVHNFGEFIGGQLGTIGLTLMPMLLFLSFKEAWIAYKKDQETRFFLAWLVVPGVLLFSYSGIQTKVEANWPQISYITAFLFVSEWICQKKSSNFRHYLILGPNVLLVLLVVFHTLSMALPLPKNADISRRMYGWREMGELIREVDKQTGHKAVFMGQGSALTTLVGFYGGIDSDRLVEAYLSGNYKVWWKDRNLVQGSDLIFVDTDDYSEWERLGSFFAESERELHEIKVRGKTIRSIGISTMRNLNKPFTFH